MFIITLNWLAYLQFHRCRDDAWRCIVLLVCAPCLNLILVCAWDISTFVWNHYWLVCEHFTTSPLTCFTRAPPTHASLVYSQLVILRCPIIYTCRMWNMWVRTSFFNTGSSQLSSSQLAHYGVHTSLSLSLSLSLFAHWSTSALSPPVCSYYHQWWPYCCSRPGRVCSLSATKEKVEAVW